MPKRAPETPAAIGHARPRTYEELRAVLASGTVHFPRRLRQVAIFLWQHPSDVAVGTIKSRVARGRVALEALMSDGALASRREHSNPEGQTALDTIMGEVDDLSNER